MSAPTCPPEHKHGETLTCVTDHKCSCVDCKAAHAEYQFWSRHMRAAGRVDAFDRVVDATGTRRRVQALAAIGWSQPMLAAELGTAQGQVYTLFRRPLVRQSTATRVAELYDRLSAAGPVAITRRERQSLTRTIADAQRRGYAAPLDWDDIDEDPELPTGEPVDVDEVAIELAIEGATVTLTRAERHVAVKALHARNYSDPRLSRLLGVNVKTITRDRQYLGLPAIPLEEALAA